MKLAVVSCDPSLDARTPLAINLASALARRGTNVLLVDGDPDCGLEDYAGLSESGIVLDRKGRVVLRSSSTDGLSLLQGYGASALEAPGDERRLDKIKRLQGEFHWIVIDTPAQTNAAFDEALALCDAIVVALPDREESLAALPVTLRAILERAKAGRAGKLEAIVLTHANPAGSPGIAGALRGLSEEFGGLVLKTRVPDDPVVAEALAACRPIADHAPSSPASHAFTHLAAEIAERIEGTLAPMAAPASEEDKRALAVAFAPAPSSVTSQPETGVFTRMLGWLGELFGVRKH